MLCGPDIDIPQVGLGNGSYRLTFYSMYQPPSSQMPSDLGEGLFWRRVFLVQNAGKEDISISCRLVAPYVVCSSVVSGTEFLLESAIHGWMINTSWISSKNITSAHGYLKPRCSAFWSWSTSGPWSNWILLNRGSAAVQPGMPLPCLAPCYWSLPQPSLISSSPLPCLLPLPFPLP